MQEYVTDALVLAKEPLRDLDVRYSFFTKRFGKIVGKATSARKITSKLAGHLEPGTLAKVRFVERNHGGPAQIVDALKYARAAAAANPGALHSLNTMLAEAEPDAALWEMLAGSIAAPIAGPPTGPAADTAFPWKKILRLLGWDPQDAVCTVCGKPAVMFFIPRQEFFCQSCSSKLARNGLSLIAY